MPRKPRRPSQPDDGTPESVVNEPQSAVAVAQAPPQTELPLSPMLPKYPGGYTIPQDRLGAYLKQFTPDDWVHCDMYLYTVWPHPKRGFSQVDKPSFAIDPQWIGATHGRGKYKLLINDRNIPYKQKQTVHECYIDLMHLSAPPKRVVQNMDLDYSGNTDYKRFLMAEGIINSEGAIVAEVQAARGSDTATEALAKIALQKADQKPSVEDQMALKTMDAMLERVKAMASGGGNNNDLLLAVMNMMMQLQQQTTTMMMKMMEVQNKPAPAQQDNFLLKQFEALQQELVATRTQFMELLGKSRGDDLIESFTKAIKLGKQIKALSGLEDGASNGMDWKNILMPLGEAIAVRLQGSTAAAAAAPAANPAAAESVGMDIPVQQPRVNVQEIIARLDPQKQTQIRQVVEYLHSGAGTFLINSFAKGESGSDFAQSVISIQDLGTYKRVAALGGEVLTLAILSWPKTRDYFANVHEELVRWVDDFLAYGQSLDTDPEEEEEAEPAAEQAPAAAAEGGAQ